MSKQEYDMRFKEGATHIICGPSESGKTSRLCSILKLKNQIIENGENTKNIVYYYSVWQSEYDKLNEVFNNVQWINKMPTNEEYVDRIKDHPRSICVIDDFQTEINNELVKIVTVSTRHYNSSCFILLQSLFPPNKLARTVSLNAKYIHIFKTPRDLSNLNYLARQLRPFNYRWIIDVYHEVTKNPYSCFLIDVRPNTEEYLRFRSSYLPNEFPMTVWNPKGQQIPS